MISVDEIDSVRAVLVALQKQGQRRQWATVVAELKKRLRVSDTVAEEYLEAMLGNGVEIAPGSKMLTICFELPADPKLVAAAQWSDCIASLPPQIREQVSAPPRSLYDLPQVEVEALVACMSTFNPSALPNEDQYVLSANMLMGSSKVLDAFSGLVSNESEIRHRPLFVVTAGPPVPDAILLVENPSAFMSLLRTNFIQQHLVICTFGYGLTLENLSQRLLDRAIIPCPAAGEQIKDLSAMIASAPCFLWGDLDWEGLRIFESLQSAIPHLQFPAIYHDMTECLFDLLRSHPYHEMFGKAGQRPPKGHAEIVRILADACSKRAVDQEAMCPIKDVRTLVTPLEFNRIKELLNDSRNTQ